MEAFIIYITVFVLAIFVGFEVITKVPPTLHTPLKSGANAISGVVVIGGIILVRLTPSDDYFGLFIGFDAAHQHAIVQGSELHEVPPPADRGARSTRCVSQLRFGC